MPDVVVQRVVGAQALLLERAERLKRLLKRAENRKVPEKFVEGAELVQQLIEGDLPIRADSMVREQMAAYKDELMEMWNTQQFKQLPSLKQEPNNVF